MLSALLSVAVSFIGCGKKSEIPHSVQNPSLIQYSTTNLSTIHNQNNQYVAAKTHYSFSVLQPSHCLHAGTSIPYCNFYSFVHLSNAANERSYGADIIYSTSPLALCRYARECKKRSWWCCVVVGADDKWWCLFARNRGANGFDCGALAKEE